jgi:hypothetical protein
VSDDGAANTTTPQQATGYDGADHAVFVVVTAFVIVFVLFFPALAQQVEQDRAAYAPAAQHASCNQSFENAVLLVVVDVGVTGIAASLDLVQNGLSHKILVSQIAEFYLAVASSGV